MTQKKLHFIGPGHGTETRNTINAIISILNDLGYTYNEALIQAHDILEKAKEANDKNADVQRQLDELILESGTSDAEVIQARGSHNLLKDRLDNYDGQVGALISAVDSVLPAVDARLDSVLPAVDARLDGLREESDNLGTTEFIRDDNYTLISIESPSKSASVQYDEDGQVQTIEESTARNNIRTTVERENDGTLKLYSREAY